MTIITKWIINIFEIYKNSDETLLPHSRYIDENFLAFT